MSTFELTAIAHESGVDPETLSALLGLFDAVAAVDERLAAHQRAEHEESASGHDEAAGFPTASSRKGSA